jgi:ankyrin repeat protein
MGNCGMSNNERFFTIARGGNAKSLKKLLDEGVRIDAVNHKFETPMMHAICKNKINGHEIVKLLIKEGAIVDFESDYDKTALMSAIYMYRFDICLELLNSGANIELKTSTGCTPLMMASMCGFSRMVQVLIERNANINCKMSPENKSVLNVVSDFDYIHNFTSWKDYDVNRDEYKPDEVMDLLLEAGADVNHRMTNGNTPLFQNQNTLTIEKFIKFGADKNIKNNEGLTAYDYAKKNRLHRFNPECYDLLCPDEPKPVNKNNIILKYKLEPVLEDNMPPKYETLFQKQSIFHG